MERSFNKNCFIPAPDCSNASTVKLSGKVTVAEKIMMEFISLK